MLACCAGDLKILKYLKNEMKYDINDVDGKGCCMLTNALLLDNWDIVIYLLENGCKVHEEIVEKNC